MKLGGTEWNVNARITFIINKTEACTPKDGDGAQLIQFYTTTLPIHGKPATVPSSFPRRSLHLNAKTNQNLIYISFSPRYKNSATITSFVPTLYGRRGEQPLRLGSHGESP